MVVGPIPVQPIRHEIKIAMTGILRVSLIAIVNQSYHILIRKVTAIAAVSPDQPYWTKVQ